jgi:hypothetical protein
VHRGDSVGESGSNVFFLGNRKCDHEPLSNLFNKLACKLSDHALVITDGSNARPKFLRKFHNTETLGFGAFSELRKQHFSYGNFDWICVGYVEQRYGPTLVWDLTRQRNISDVRPKERNGASEGNRHLQCDLQESIINLVLFERPIEEFRTAWLSLKV